MPRPLGKIRIMMSSRVLLDLEAADRVFQEHGLKAYHDYMWCRGDFAKDIDPDLGCRRLQKGPLFDFAIALSRLNKDPANPIVEIGMSAKDDTDTGFVLFENLNRTPLGKIVEYSTTTSGGPVNKNVHKAFKTDLFLTRNALDAQIAIDMGVAAAVINFPPQGTYDYEATSGPLHIVVDGDAVAFGDSAEVSYRRAVDSGIPYEDALTVYKNGERSKAKEPVEPGPFTAVLAKITQLNAEFPKGQEPFVISLLTARGGPANARVFSTAKEHKIKFNGDSGWIGGADKGAWLEAYRPHIFFDDQMTHLERGAPYCPTGHVPYKTGSPMYEYLLEQARTKENRGLAKRFQETSVPSPAIEPKEGPIKRKSQGVPVITGRCPA